MNELVKITEHNGKKAVSARELYERLGFNPSNCVDTWGFVPYLRGFQK